MKVWLVSTGMYSAYRIEGVYDSEELANAFAATLHDPDVMVEEFPLNEHVDALKSGRVPFRITGHYSDEGKLILSKVESFSDREWKEGLTVEVAGARNAYTRYLVCVWAKEAQGAMKIAMEMITQHKAINAG